MIKREDVIVDPTDPRVKGLIGKLVYMGNSFAQLGDLPFKLHGLAVNSSPFRNCGGTGYTMIAPVPEPTYREFKSAEEFAPFRDEWIIGKGDAENFFRRVIDYGPQGITISDSSSQIEDVKFICYSWEDALGYFKFEDGTPFGVKE